MEKGRERSKALGWGQAHSIEEAEKQLNTGTNGTLLFID